ncbi:pyridoxal phosphate-dependent aminotransferase family protein [Campylobacter hepaticus]|uniref:Aminotransferase class I/II-fold pyridoxal phosphate-dependent enzyme n=1 Tax=Campylobacter hepaticus TaxID=1813019 RepID=A0A6A7JQE7_9BACT|nr:pyridoxal phosphate-dependent aminotransferase family protein [Campylobacter hepaticus]AXP09539.1 pyridoxal phosphate-dependent aminotransferase family protein [Campylobacter hepaticus]MCZ0772848.1 pyridoxal phosphate-dependent aminotransferase family protein [Campylobacter hepaticus]MCZ0774317.1 pyridoxal phosphate-dependent aminotransferase family protein [Campylobacter hepaticus]MCZ0775569.1 pyridoxal phosphate-dependent aminotransferase family protein [Campylobacter hepaticus]MPV54149.1
MNLEIILQNLHKNYNIRTLTPLKHEGKFIYKENKKLLNLASNDYLNLATCKELKHEFLNTLEEDHFFFSSSSSRSLSGNFTIYQNFENFLKSKFKEKEVLHFNSGYHLNISCIAALASIPNTLFLADKFIHASMIDGLKLGKANFFRFHHNNIDNLEKLIKKHYNQYENIIILTEALFSMDGDFSNLKALCDLKKHYKKIKLYIDEAHSVGCFDSEGLGLVKRLNLENEVDFLIFTFGKALASMGACIISHKKYKSFFINKARAFIYSTALPPINVAWTQFIFKKMPIFEEKRKKLQDLSVFFKTKLQEKNYQILGDAYIISLLLIENQKALKIANMFETEGIFAPAIKEPTVPKNTARIRFSLHTGLNINELERIIKLL